MAQDDPLRSGHAALVAGDWETARTCFEAAGDTPDALDGLSRAVHFGGDYDRAIALKERALAGYRSHGRAAEAADAARWLAFIHGMAKANMAVASGWMARAESLLEGVEECPTHGWLALDTTEFTEDPLEHERQALAALSIARRFGDVELESAALALLGRVRVVAGRVAEGMRLLDAAMVAVSGGEVVGVGTIGDIYCRLMSACEHATDVRRAEQWMAAADHLVAWKDFVAPICRCHYGGILIATGRWAEAEQQLLTALEAFETGYRMSRVSALLRLAELRVRQGRLEEAERLLDGCDWHPSARRSLAAIAFARQDLGLAEDLARLCFEGSDTASPECVPLFELQISVQLARGDVGAARETLEQLLALGGRGEHVDAVIAACTGRVLAAEDDERAIAQLKVALEAFARLELPLEAARARAALARALAADSPQAAVAEARLALAAFDRLGAAHDADAAAGLLRELGATAGRGSPRSAGSLTKREREVLALLAAGMSNADISGRLYISRRTAEHHVASILSKLELGSRAEAAAFVAREGTQDP